MEKQGRCLVAVSEGVVDKDGKPFMTRSSGSKEADAHGNLQLSGSGALGDMLSDLVKEKLKIKRVRADTLGYAQRSYLGVVSDVDAARGARGRGEGRPVRHLARPGRVHHHPAHRQLLGGLPPRGPGADRGQDKDDAEGVPHRGRATTRPGSSTTTAGRCSGSGFPNVHRIRAPKVAKILKNDK